MDPARGLLDISFISDDPCRALAFHRSSRWDCRKRIWRRAPGAPTLRAWPLRA